MSDGGRVCLYEITVEPSWDRSSFTLFSALTNSFSLLAIHYNTPIAWELIEERNEMCLLGPKLSISILQYPNSNYIEQFGIVSLDFAAF